MQSSPSLPSSNCRHVVSNHSVSGRPTLDRMSRRLPASLVSNLIRHTSSLAT